MEHGHGSTAKRAPTANEGARGLVLRQPDGERALLRQTDRLAYATVRRLMQPYGPPPGMELEDVRVIARTEAWKASQRHDPAKGRLSTCVITPTRGAVREVYRTPAYGGYHRGTGRRLETVELSEAHAAGTPDPHDQYHAADARMVVERVRQGLRHRPRLWRILQGLGIGLTGAEQAEQEGVSASRVQQLRAEALGAARRELAL